MEINYWSQYLGQRLERRRMLAAGGSALAGTVLMACGGSDDDGGGDGQNSSAPAAGKFSPGEGDPRPGGRLESSATSVASFNPISDYSQGDTLGGIYVYDRPLSTREDERRYVLEAMASIELPDPTTVVMKLIPGQTFQDVAPVNGRRLTAADIVATQNYATTLTNNFDKTFVTSYLDRAEATDDLTVVYHLKRPNAYLYGTSMLGSKTGQVIIPQETFENLNTATQVGSGPYLVKRAQLSVDYLYAKNPKFRGSAKGFPNIDEVHIVTIPDTAALEAAYRGGNLDVWGGTAPTPTQVQSLQSDPAANIHVKPGLASMTWILNMTKGFPWQSDVRVREALWRLTNRQQVLDLAYSSFGEVPVGLIPVGMTLYQPDPAKTAPYWQEDVQKARQLLSAAGWDKSRRWELIARGGGAVDEQVALVWQQQLARGDVATDIFTVTGSAQLFQRQTDNDWQIRVSTPPATDSPFQMIRMQHTNSWSDTFRRFGLMDPAIDALIEKSEETVDFEENRRMVVDIQMQCIQKYSSAYFMVTQNSAKLLSKRVQNYDLTQLNVPQHQAWLKV